MTTRELLVYLQRKVPAYTQPELISLIDQIQLMILSKVTAQREKIDETTGMPPYLITQDQIYTYNCPPDCLRTIQIFAEDIKSYTSIKYDATIKSYSYRGAMYYGLPIKSTDAKYGILAKVTFVGFNPGTNDKKYFHHYSVMPDRITAPSVNLTIPEQHHFAIADGVLARIRSEKYGDNSEYQFWTKRTMLDIVSELNQGAQPYMGETPTREEYRHYTDSVRGNRVR